MNGLDRIIATYEGPLGARLEVHCDRCDWFAWGYLKAGESDTESGSLWLLRQHECKADA